MKVTQSVYCRIGDDGASNNGFVVCDECCIAVDTSYYPDQTRKDLDSMRHVTEKDVKFLINTHFHSDHTLGNMYFSDIIAHKHCYKKLKERTPLYMKMAEEGEEKERFEGFFVRLPTLVFTDALILLEAPKIEIVHYGGHTEGSATVYIPEEKVLFSGDLLFAGIHPYLGDADIQQWINALQNLLQLDAKKIIPGHGPLCDEREIRAHIEYLETFSTNLRVLKEKYSKEEICNNIDLLEMPERKNEEMLKAGLKMQYDKI